MRSLFLALFAFSTLAAAAIETKPYSTREFKTREIKFRRIFGSDEAEEQSSASRRSAQLREERARAAQERQEQLEQLEYNRELRARENEIQRQIRENERQQRQLELERQRQEAEEWRQYLAELRAANAELRSSIKAAKERPPENDVRCGAVLSNGRPCPNLAIADYWYCADHKNPPLPKSDITGVYEDSKDVSSEKSDTPLKSVEEDSVPFVDDAWPRRKRKHVCKESHDNSDEKSSESAAPVTMTVMVVGILAIGVLAIIFMRFRKAPRSAHRYGQIAAQRRQHDKKMP